MSDTRKKIIIAEIHYWKNNRMLPEQYCNYLLALYTEGNTNQYTKEIQQNQKHQNKWQWLTIIFLPIALFVIYFTELSIILQMAFYIFVMILAFAVVFLLYKRKLSYQVALIVAALLFLLLSVEICSRFFGNNTLYLYLSLFCNCIAWLLIGKKLSLIYFLISGILGIILLLFSFFL